VEERGKGLEREFVRFAIDDRAELVSMKPR
jgi:hypothetical protein